MLLATAAAAAPLFLSASGDAAMADVLHAVPAHASAQDGPTLRLRGGNDPTTPLQAELLAQLARIPGTTEPRLSAASIGREVAPSGILFAPYVGTGSGTGAHRVGARLFGQQDLATALVPAPGSPSAAAAGAGVWLPQPVADQLHVRPGDTVTIGVQIPAGTTRFPVRLAGLYDVGTDGRTPLDRTGSTLWSDRAGLLPVDPDQLTRPSYLVVADIATVQSLADKVGDTLLWTAQSELDPVVPTLASAERTADAIGAMRRLLLDPARTGVNSGALRPTLVSGLPELVGQAESASDATVERTRSVGWAGVALGLAAVLAVAVLTSSRRRHETAHATGVGMRPVALGALAAVEVLPVAALGWVLGVGVAWVVVVAWGPPATPSDEAVHAAVRDAGLACLLGIALVAVAATALATVAARVSSRSAMPTRRAWPWEAGLAVVALTAAFGLLGHAGDSGPVALLVPLLVVAATGALTGRAVLALVARATAGRDRRDGSRGGATTAPPRSIRTPTLWLAARRVAVPGAERVLVVALLTTGLGMLLYAVTAASAVRATTEDRVAALSGAAAVGTIDASYQLDRSAPLAPEPKDPGFTEPVPADRLPPVHDPVLPHGSTVVWRAEGTIPGQAVNLPVMVVDPTTFAAAASWGTGPDLARARSLLPRLAQSGGAVAARVTAGDDSDPVPALLVGDADALARATTASAPPLRPGDQASVAGSSGTWTVPMHLLDVLATFPGIDPTALAMVVVPSDAFFAHLGAQDPRYRPRPGHDNQSAFQTQVWSTGTASLDAALAEHGVTASEVRTEAAVRQRPDFVAALRSLGYLLALGAATAGLAVVGLGLFADRSAARARVDDLMLARVGMGRRRTRGAHLVELTGIVATAALAAVLGVWMLARLGALGLDPQASVAPALRLRIGAGGLSTLLLAALACVVVGAVATRGQSGRRNEGRVLRADA